jgi:geranylgeranyl diphosphate synthase type I
MLEEEIAKSAKQLNEKIRTALVGDGSPLYKASFHLPSQGGKRMRPFLVVKACEAVGGSLDDAIPAAIAIELIHNFTLVHDDIMDNDVLRRGVPTVHKLWGVPVGILAGDLMFAEAFHVVLSAKNDADRLRRAADTLAKATITLSEGQYLDMSFESRNDVSEAEYLEMIYKKTGALFQAGGELGGIMAGADEKKISLLGEFARNMGIAFQIFDDYLGMTSAENVLGKSVGNDIREGKKTLIVIKAMQTPAREKLLNLLGKKSATDPEISDLVDMLRRERIFDSVYRKAEGYAGAARLTLSALPPSEARDMLNGLASYAVTRKK